MPIQESYGKLGEEDNFDVAFWQSQTPEVLFKAASQLAKDYLLIKEGYADEPRLQRTVESFQNSPYFTDPDVSPRMSCLENTM